MILGGANKRMLPDWFPLRLGPIGTHISNHASFDHRNYGFKKLSDLFMAIDLFEMKKTNGSVLWVKDKKRAKRSTNGGMNE